MTIAAQRKDENNAKHACQPDICSAAQILELGKIKCPVKGKRKYTSTTSKQHFQE